MKDVLQELLHGLGCEFHRRSKRYFEERTKHMLIPEGVSAPDLRRRMAARLIARESLRCDVLKRTGDKDEASHYGNLAQVAGLWVEQGMKKIEMSRMFCAALLVSSATHETVLAAHPPWTTFVIDVPNGLIFAKNIDGGLGNIHKILVSCLYVLGELPDSKTGNDGNDWQYTNDPRESDGSPRDRHWAFYAYSNDGRANLHTERISDLQNPETSDPETSLSGEDITARALICRLILMTCAAMSMPGAMTRRSSKIRLTASYRDRKPDAYLLDSPIKIDFTDRVREFSLTGSFGERGKLEVRTMVRGHFKQVHYGSGWSLSKTAWIHPYWKGPETGAVVTRAHVLVDSQNET